MTVALDAVVQLRNAQRTFPGPPQVHALRDASLSIRRGEYVAITGPSGSGKSTLLNLIGLLDRPTSGTYHLDGVDTAHMRANQRAALRGQRIGFVFQSFHLMTLRTVTENVALSMVYQGLNRKIRNQRAREVLESVGLAHRLDTVAGVLSGGEKQRVAIARSLASGPSLLLCDEPTGNLDTCNAETILELLTNIHQSGQTILVITHDPHVASHASRQVRIVDGVLSEVNVQ